MNANIDTNNNTIIVTGGVMKKTEAVGRNETSRKNPEVKESNIQIQNEDINKKATIWENGDFSAEKKPSDDSEKVLRNEENKDNKKETSEIESAKSLKNKNIIIQENGDETSGIDIKNNNIKENFSDYSLEQLLNSVKKQSEDESTKDKDNGQDQNKNMILNVVLPIFQMNNRFYLIVQQLAICKNTIKEIEASQLSQRKIIEHKIEMEKLLIEINAMKSVIELLKTPSFVIVKRKLLDLIIFSLIKSNKDKF